MSERNRAILFQRLAPVVGDEDALGEMLSCYPARNADEPISKDFLRAELTVFRAEVQAEFAAVRGEMQAEFAAVRGEMREEFAAVRGEMREEFAAVRGEMSEGFASLRSEMASLSADVDRRITSSTRWMIGMMFVMNTGLVAAFTAIA